MNEELAKLVWNNADSIYDLDTDQSFKLWIAWREESEFVGNDKVRKLEILAIDTKEKHARSHLKMFKNNDKYRPEVKGQTIRYFVSEEISNHSLGLSMLKVLHQKEAV